MAMTFCDLLSACSSLQLGNWTVHGENIPIFCLQPPGVAEAKKSQPWQEHWLGKHSIHGTANDCAKDHKGLLSDSPSLCSELSELSISSLLFSTSRSNFGLAIDHIRSISHWFHVGPGALAANLYFGQEWKVRGGASHNAVPRETFTLVWGSCGVWRFEPGEPGKPFLQPLLFVLCWAWKSCNARCLLYHALHSVDNATNQ